MNNKVKLLLVIMFVLAGLFSSYHAWNSLQPFGEKMYQQHAVAVAESGSNALPNGTGFGGVSTLRTSDRLSTSNMEQATMGNTLQEELRPLGVSQYHVFRNTPPSPKSLPMVMLVHHREFHAGCHSFERFFHPNWETILVVGQDMAEQYGLKKLAEQAKSPGIHLALLNVTMTGEWLGRQVAFRILNSYSSSPPPLMLSAHCDIHPLPEWHAQHKPFEKIVERMVHEFLEENRRNQEQKTNVNEYGPIWDAAPLNQTVCEQVYQDKYRPLLLMNVAMAETLPSSETLNGSKFHSREAGLSVPWKERFSRPEGLASNEPWMSDVSTWVEDHLVLYNSTMLAMIVDDLAKVHATISAGVKAIPILLCQKGWKAVRLNDEPMFYDFAKSQLQSSGPSGNFSLYDPSKYGSVSLDWLFTRSIVNLADVNSPLGCLREYMRLRTRAGLNVNIACIIAKSHFQPNHVPVTVWTDEIQKNENLVEAIMKIQGYELATRTDETLHFVSMPIYHTPPHDWFLDNLQQQGARGVVIGPMPPESDLHYIGLYRNGTLTPESFFLDHKLRRKKSLQERTDRNRLVGYSKSAARVCRLLLHSSSWDAGSLLTPREVQSTLAPVADMCLGNYEWDMPNQTVAANNGRLRRRKLQARR